MTAYPIFSPGASSTATGENEWALQRIAEQRV